jgi:CubicO group peptidase (beta-lactamase class C family)
MIHTAFRKRHTMKRFKLASFILGLIAGCLSLCTEAGVSERSLAEFNHDFQSMCDYGQFSGAVLLAVDDHIIFERACGLANRNFNISNTVDTKFNLGSVSKLFTSVAIAQLIEKNKLALTTSSYAITRSWLTSDISKQITVGQLLIHSSGLGNYIESAGWKAKDTTNAYQTTDDFKQLIEDEKPLFTPGNSQYYSNNGYILLGAFIEKLSQQDYRSYLHDQIFLPANMHNTFLLKLDEPALNKAEGYIYQCTNAKCIWKNNYFQANFVGNASGGAYSTVGDLYKFAVALHQARLLSPELTQAVLSPDIVTPVEKMDVYVAIRNSKKNNLEVPVNFSPYGFAGAWNRFGLAAWNQPALIGQTGGMAGASAFFATSPSGNYTIIILSNVSGSGTVLLYKRIRQLFQFSAEIMNL